MAGLENNEELEKIFQDKLPALLLSHKGEAVVFVRGNPEPFRFYKSYLEAYRDEEFCQKCREEDVFIRYVLSIYLKTD